ncbi:hypothetical protein L2E82_35697 [Cichorium intybus]|uniref:Uncharacterized protein n=1 Tax=Cichorium intybus TaxID=13427 RepID=A0ACB9BPK8_CICIN|nr:hypothetical protein L2E82_35697 [Cichorium intybus]
MMSSGINPYSRVLQIGDTQLSNSKTRDEPAETADDYVHLGVSRGLKSCKKKVIDSGRPSTAVAAQAKGTRT